MKKIQKPSIKLEKMENTKISLVNMVYIFTICSILGFVVETIFVYLVCGRIVNRGMLFGPYCPIYGFGGIILYLLFYNLKASKTNIPYAFITAACVLGAFELLCGLGFKYILNIEMWNYDGMFLEILDYTTVPILIGWGILGTIYIFFIQPVLLKIISFVPKHLATRIAIVIVCIFLFDFGISTIRNARYPELLQKMVDPELATIFEINL